MRSALILILSVSCASFCWAQAPAATPAAANSPPASASGATGAVEKRTERIHIEDADSKIDELRIGGETQSIDVQPKGGMPAYQVAPTSGERTWKILGF